MLLLGIHADVNLNACRKLRLVLERRQRPVPKRAVRSVPTVKAMKTERRQRCFSGRSP